MTAYIESAISELIRINASYFEHLFIYLRVLLLFLLCDATAFNQSVPFFRKTCEFAGAWIESNVSNVACVVRRRYIHGFIAPAARRRRRLCLTWKQTFNAPFLDRSLHACKETELDNLPFTNLPNTSFNCVLSLGLSGARPSFSVAEDGISKETADNDARLPRLGLDGCCSACLLKIYTSFGFVPHGQDDGEMAPVLYSLVTWDLELMDNVRESDGVDLWGFKVWPEDVFLFPTPKTLTRERRELDPFMLKRAVGAACVQY